MTFVLACVWHRRLACITAVTLIVNLSIRYYTLGNAISLTWRCPGMQLGPDAGRLITRFYYYFNLKRLQVPTMTVRGGKYSIKSRSRWRVRGGSGSEVVYFREGPHAVDLARLYH
eukprot:g70301.t1